MKLIRFPFIFMISICLSFPLFSQEYDEYKVLENYDKQEVDITMRDGVNLHTRIYSPKDTSNLYAQYILSQRSRF